MRDVLELVIVDVESISVRAVAAAVVALVACVVASAAP